jgi:O-antigen/teichoic acid export membrane protein
MPDIIRGALGVIDQGVCAFGNFITVILLSRALVPEQFGKYALIFNAVMIFSSIQNALVTGPMRVLGAPRASDAGYVRSQLRTQAAVLLVEIPMLAVVLVWFVGDRAALLGALAAMAALQLHEFVRSVNVTRLALPQLLKLDALTHLVRIGCLAMLFAADVLTVWNALAVICVSSLVALPYLTVRGKFAPVSGTFGSNWQLGRWLLADAIAFTLSTRVYLYLVALWLGTAEVAALSASQTLVSVANLVVGGLIVVAIPAARLKLAQAGYHAWRSWWVGTAGLIAALGAVLFGAVGLLAADLMRLFYPAYYVSFAPLVAILALGAWIDAVNTVVVSALWTAEKPQVNVVGKVLSAVFMVIWAYPGIHAFGIAGAAMGLVVTPAIWLVVNLVYLFAGGLGEQRMNVALGRTNEAVS